MIHVMTNVVIMLTHCTIATSTIDIKPLRALIDKLLSDFTYSEVFTKLYYNADSLPRSTPTAFGWLAFVCEALELS